MHATTETFKENAREALADAQLQRALAGLPTGLVAQRTAARGRLPEFEALREVGRSIKDHTLAHLDLYRKAIPQAHLRRLGGRDHQLDNDLSEVAQDIRRVSQSA